MGTPAAAVLRDLSDAHADAPRRQRGRNPRLPASAPSTSAGFLGFLVDARRHRLDEAELDRRHQLGM
jgi:hypothetical protein